MLEFLDAHQAEFWIFVGFALLISEVLLLGLSTIILLFFASGALLTGLLMALGILPESWLAGIAAFGLLSAASTALLWRPLRRLQRGDAAPPEHDRTSDLIGYEFLLGDDIDRNTPSRVSYSGIDWTVRPDPSTPGEAIAANTRVRVTTVDVGVFWVTAADAKGRQRRRRRLF